jgi:hypothetical protein
MIDAPTDARPGFPPIVEDARHDRRVTPIDFTLLVWCHAEDGRLRRRLGEKYTGDIPVNATFMQFRWGIRRARAAAVFDKLVKLGYLSAGRRIEQNIRTVRLILDRSGHRG